MLQRMLRCSRRPLPDDCPREPGPPDWQAPQLSVGGDFAQPPELNLHEVYTPGELQTLVMPPCGPGCVHIGRPPPPPSRSAEELCRAENLGGPCTPPPERADEH